MDQPQLILRCLLHVLVCTYVLLQLLDLLRAVLLCLDILLQLLLLLYVGAVLGPQLNAAHRDNDRQEQDHRADAQHASPVLLHLFFPASCPVLLFDTSHINYSPILPAVSLVIIFNLIFFLPFIQPFSPNFPILFAYNFFRNFPGIFDMREKKKLPSTTPSIKYHLMLPLVVW